MLSILSILLVIALILPDAALSTCADCCLAGNCSKAYGEKEGHCCGMQAASASSGPSTSGQGVCCPKTLNCEPYTVTPTAGGDQTASAGWRCVTPPPAMVGPQCSACCGDSTKQACKKMFPRANGHKANGKCCTNTGGHPGTNGTVPHNSSSSSQCCSHGQECVAETGGHFYCVGSHSGGGSHGRHRNGTWLFAGIIALVVGSVCVLGVCVRVYLDKRRAQGHINTYTALPGAQPRVATTTPLQQPIIAAASPPLPPAAAPAGSSLNDQ